MSKRWGIPAVVALIAALVLPVAAQEARSPASAARMFGDDYFAVGGTVRIDDAIAGDLLATGGTVRVDADIGGDVIIAGGNLRLGGDVGHSVYATGGELTITGSVENNARIAGGQVELARDGVIGGNLTAAGGRVAVNGAVKGYLQAAGGEIILNGPVGGDVVATGGRIHLGPQARIAGKLRYGSRDAPTRAAGAEVIGGIEPLPWRGPTVQSETISRAGRGVAWLWTAGMVVLAGVLVALLPGFTARAGATVYRRFGWSVLAGFIALVCIPVAAVILMVTLIGLPLGIILLLLYPPLLLAGYAVSGIALGDWAIARIKGEAASTGLRVAVAMLAMLAIALLARIPVLGGFVIALALLVGVGALILLLARRAPP